MLKQPIGGGEGLFDNYGNCTKENDRMAPYAVGNSCEDWLNEEEWEMQWHQQHLRALHTPSKGAKSALIDAVVS